MDNLAYLAAAYSLIWAVVFGYLLILAGRQRALRRDLDRLKEREHGTPQE